MTKKNPRKILAIVGQKLPTNSFIIMLDLFWTLSIE